MIKKTVMKDLSQVFPEFCQQGKGVSCFLIFPFERVCTAECVLEGLVNDAALLIVNHCA